MLCNDLQDGFLSVDQEVSCIEKYQITLVLMERGFYGRLRICQGEF